MIAYAAARDLARSLHLHPPIDLASVTDKLGLEVTDWRFRGRLREVIMDGVVGIDSRLPEPWVRWLTAHAIGHHLLHTGTSFYLDCWQWVNRLKAERQAEEFAAGLLMPSATALVGQAPSAVARRLGVPQSKVPWLWKCFQSASGESTGALAMPNRGS